MRLTRKIAVLVAVPLLAMIVFAGLAVAVALTDAQRAERLSTLVGVAQRCAELTRALQEERVAAVARMLAPGPEATQAYLATTATTDDAVRALRGTWGGDRLPEPAGSRLLTLDRQLGLLETLRDQTMAGSLPISAVAFRYRILVASTLDYREVVGPAGQASAGVADAVRAAAELSRAGEALGLQQVTVLRTVDAGPLSRATAAELAAARASFTEAVTAFTTSAPTQWRDWWRDAAIGPEVLAAQALQDEVGRVLPGDHVRVDPARWTQVMGVRIDLVRGVQARVDAALLEWVEQLHGDALRRAGMITLGVCGAAALALTLAVRLGRPVVVDLRRLRDGALRVAYQQLPQLVARLNQPRGVRNVDPDAEAQRAPSTGVTARHEVGEVAAAFDEVYRAAVRSAAELARSRQGVAQMYVSLARRLQRRTSQLTARLDTAERDEPDTARLAWLFGMDHLVTLMRRTTDSLLVLGGHGPGAPRGENVAMHDVVRGAIARVEEYARVVLGTIDPEVHVAGHAVEEIVLLLAELMDNATVHSRGPVVVHARRLADRAVVQIIDDGIGLDEARRRTLNERLAAPVVDANAVSRMGLTVVGLLAAHHGLRVELRANRPRGTIAEVVLAGALLRSPARSTVDSHGPAAALPGRLAGPVVTGPTGGYVGQPTAAPPAVGNGRHRARPQAITGSPLPSPRPPSRADHTSPTEELPVYVATRTASGLPVRAPQGHLIPPRRNDRARRPALDPHRLAEGITAYARGVHRAQSQQNRPSWTFDQGA